MKEERLERAKTFRTAHSSDLGGVPNAAPYLIGVWDTVAALGFPLTGPALVIPLVVAGLGFVAAVAGLLLLVSWLLPIGLLGQATYRALFLITLFVTVAGFAAAWVANYVY